MLHIVKQLRSSFVGIISNGFLNAGEQMFSSDFNEADTNNNELLSGEEIKQSSEKVREAIRQVNNGKDLEDDKSFRIKDIKRVLKSQGVEIVDNMQENSNSINQLTNETGEEVSSLRESMELSKIDVTKFNRTLNRGDKGEDVAELNKFLLLKTKMFNIGDIDDLYIFDGKTLVMLTKYQKSIGGTADGELTIRKNKEFATLRNIKKDIKGAFESKKGDALEQKEDLFSADEKIVSNFDERYDIKDKNKVKALQQALVNLNHKLKGKNNGVDGSFGGSTLTAFKLEEARLERKIKVSQYTGRRSITDTDIKHDDFDGVSDQIDKTSETVKNLKEKLVITSEINKDLSKYLFREKSGYSIEALVRKVTGNDKFSKILSDKEQYDELLSQDGNKKKLEKATKYLTHYDNSDESTPGNRRWEKVSDSAIKALPWLFGIYLGDLPLPFIQKMTGGADINKSVAFKNWIAGGMEGEFKKYYKENKTDSNVLSEQYDLRGQLSTLDISKQDKASILSGKLDQLSVETRELIRTYIAVRLIPDLKILQRESYNAFERGAWYTLGGLFGLTTDDKYDKGNSIIEAIEEMNNKGLSSLEMADEVLRLLSEEGDVDKAKVYTENRQEYMKGVELQDKVFNSISELLKAGYSEFKIIYYFEGIEDLKNFGINKSDTKSLEKLFTILAKGPILGNELKAFIEKNPSTYNFIKSVGKGELMGKYQLSKVPTNSNLNYLNEGNARHGASLRKYSADGNMERAYNQVTTTTSEKGSEISTLGFAYKSFVEKGGLVGISYSDFDTAFQSGEFIDLSEVENTPIINTGRKSHQETLSSFVELAKNKGDTQVIKLAPIEKTFTYYKDGKQVIQNVTYNLYLRPDCSNTLLVPSSIDTKTTEVEPNFETRTLTQVAGRLPVIIPWYIVNQAFGSNGNGNSFSSTPGEDGELITGDITGGGGSDTGSIGGGFGS